MKKNDCLPRQAYWHRDFTKILLIMKLTVLLLTVAVFNLYAHTEAQTVTISGKNIPLKKVFSAIEKQTGYVVFTSTNVLAGTKPVSLSVNDMRVADFLKIIFKDQHINYQIEDKTILLSSKPIERTAIVVVVEPAKSIPPPPPPLIEIKGKILDQNGAAIEGASILIKGTQKGSTSDNQGNFSMKVKDNNITLIISFTGYKTQEIALKGLEEITVQLALDVKALEEVVIIGYGTMKKRDLTGSVASVSNKTLAILPVSSIESALQGQVAGVSVVSSGGPGTSPTVRIRGIGSISFASDPLYVVDGIPVGNLNNFDIKDMESVNVLKDAASAAIYGSRAANGVVIITTKQGKKDGKIHFDIDASTGVQSAWRRLNLLNRDEYLKFGTTLLTNAGQPLPYRFSHMSDPIYLGATQTYAQTETNWQSEMFRTAPITQINLNLSGGTEKSKFFSSFSRFKQEGIMIGTDYDRYSYRVNAESNISKRITIGENIKISYSETGNEQITGGRAQIKTMTNQIPYIPVHDPTLAGGYRSANAKDGTDPANPVRNALMDKDKTYIVNVVGSAFLEMKLFNFLKYRSTVGVEYSAYRRKQILPIYSDGFNGRTSEFLTDNRTTYYSPIFTNQLTFDKRIGKHSINAVLVAEQQTTKSDYLYNTGYQPSNTLIQLDGSTSQIIVGNLSETALLSYAGRLNYSFADKYLFNVSVRRDGSSVFAPGKKWGNFPGASVGWVVSKESFMKNIKAISELKLRASYGSLGFNAVGAYPWQSAVNTNTSAVLNNAESIGAYYNSMPNTELKWEITTMTNLGFDLALLDNRLTLTAEYYQRKVDNLILNNPLAASMGYTNNPPSNVGSMKNWGYEFQAGYKKFDGDFQYAITANLGMTKNKVLSLGPANPSISSGSQPDYGAYDITKTEAGHSIQGFYGWVTDGIFQTQTEINTLNANPLKPYQADAKPGDIKFKDLNNDGVIDDKDRTYLGSFLPDFTYGFNFTANYKGFDASLFIQGVKGNDVYNGTKVITQGMIRLFNQDKAVLNAWTPQNTNTDIPRAVSGDPNHNTRTSNRFIEDGSYLRIKNLSIGYTIPGNLLHSWSGNAISQVRFYVTAQNLLTLTKYTGYDPEIASAYGPTFNGIDYGQFPQARAYTIGIKLSF